MTTQVEKFLTDLETFEYLKARIVESVRLIYKRFDCNIEERFIYGGIGFFLKGELIGGVYINTKYVSVVFSRGNELSDPKHLLEGKGKFRRHLRIYHIDDIQNKMVEFFAKQIIQL